MTFCIECGSAKSPFGVGVSLRKGQLGKWYCREHWPGREKFRYIQRDGWVAMETIGNVKGDGDGDDSAGLPRDGISTGEAGSR